MWDGRDAAGASVAAGRYLLVLRAGGQAAAEDGLDSSLEALERERILEALNRTRWNRTRAAELLGISFRALRYRLARLGLDRAPEADE